MKEETLKQIEALNVQLMHVGDLIIKDTRDAIATRDHIEVIRHYDQLRICAAKIKQAREAISELEDTMSRNNVPEIMRDAGVKTVTVIGVGRVTISHRFSCSMLDKDAGIKWLKDNGHSGLVQETVNSATLGSFAKNMIQEQGKELPIDVFKTSVNAFTSITKV